jgi:hypothetical protein
MQSADHVHLSGAAGQRGADFVDNLREAELERVRIPATRAECAEFAGQQTNVRIIDVEIADVGRDVSIFARANDVGEKAERIEIIASEQARGVRLINPFIGGDLVKDRPEKRGKDFRGEMHGRAEART